MNTNQVTLSILSLWTAGRKTKTSTGGWISGNAVCCHHRGETQDKRGRGGLLVEGSSIVWHCFNCNFKTRYQAGSRLSFNMRKLLEWMGASTSDIQRIALEAIRVKEWMQEYEPELLHKIEKPEFTFTKRDLPEEALPFEAYAEFYVLSETSPDKRFTECVEYAYNRKIDIVKYDLHWSPKMPDRIIIPYYWKGNIVGYTARSILDKKPKYLNNNDTGYVYNIDRQDFSRQFVIVAEGTFDAMSVDGVAILRADINDEQISIIESLNKEVVVVPDNNKTGLNMVDRALELGWSVSFPFWFENPNLVDINDAIIKYDKLFVLKSIVEGKESNSTKIQLLKKKLG